MGSRAALALTASLLLASLPASAEIRECVGQGGHTVFTNDYCPPGYSLKETTRESGSGRARGSTSPGRPAVSSGQDIEAQIEEIARREYPNDAKMQQYIYNKQLSAYRYMLTVTDAEVLEIAAREYPNDYSMQKYVYDKQLLAKRYMDTVGDQEVKALAVREYPYDYSMQKYTYDKQLLAKEYMSRVNNYDAKRRAEQEYPYDYSMQKYTYDKITAGR